MPDFSTVFRDLGTVPTIICIGFVVLIGYSIIKGGSGSGKNGGSSSSNSSSSSSNNSAPPTA